MPAAALAATLDLVIVPGPRLIASVVVIVVIGIVLAMREALLDAAGFVWELIVKRDAAKTATATPPLDSVASALEQIRQRDASFTRDGFLQQASETIRQVQHARTELTPELARERLADSAWLQLSRQVGQAGLWRERVVPTTALRSVEVVDARCEPNQDVIRVRSASVEDSARATAPEASRLVRETIEDWSFVRGSGNTAPWLLSQMRQVAANLVPRFSATR
ncbi:MAG TPA: TIM44-like domain-containing protein [Candidatus Dormibacteraeota bacterium]|jgi:predicted lipid-binding transport protein (Tim44 family)|nr:TIM44-like domain-containing protein [Candidatus Dormibacteraeota bacterium]